MRILGGHAARLTGWLMGTWGVVACLVVWLLAMPTQAGADEIALPDMKLPYADGQGIKWTSGPHAYLQAADLAGTIPAGEGSGIDFARGGLSDEDKSFDVLAIADGTVLEASQTEAQCWPGFGFGCVVAVQHDQGGSVAIYAHLKPGSIASSIHRGQRVFQGMRLGRSGKSGQQPGVHLHLELRDGKPCTAPTYYVSQDADTGGWITAIDPSGIVTSQPKGPDGKPDPAFKPRHNCIDGHLDYGNPVSWGDLITLHHQLDSYVIGSLWADGDGLTAFNYNGSAVRGESKLLYGFPFYDGNGHPHTSAAATVSGIYECLDLPDAKNCELNDRDPDTQFAGGGSFGGGGATRPTIALAAQSLDDAGELISTNVPMDPPAEALPCRAPDGWSVGSLVGLNRGAEIWGAPGRRGEMTLPNASAQEPYEVKVIGVPTCVDQEVWVDVSGLADGDPTSATGWVSPAQAAYPRPTLATGPDLAPNPSFEQGIDSPTQWHLNGSGSWLTSGGHESPRAISLNGPTVRDGVAYIYSWDSEPLAVEPGRTYRLSTWVRWETSSIVRATVSIKLDWGSYTNWVAYTFSADSDVAGAWRRVEGDVLIPPTVRQASINLSYVTPNRTKVTGPDGKIIEGYVDPGPAHRVFFDDVSLARRPDPQ